MTQQLINELTRAKAVFQLRAIKAAMGIPDKDFIDEAFTALEAEGLRQAAAYNLGEVR